MKALTDEDVIAVNLSIPAAVSKLLGLERVLLDMKDRTAAALPGMERDFPEKLVQYALGLERLSMTRDGGVAYRCGDPGVAAKPTARLEPVELLARCGSTIM